MITIDRLTDANFYPEGEFCIACPHHGEPNGCNREGGACDAYSVFVDAYDRLAAYEDTGLLPAEIMAMREELEAAKIAMDDMRFAYINKDEDFPHQFEKLALMEVENIIGKFGELQKNMLDHLGEATAMVESDHPVDTNKMIAPIDGKPITGNRVLSLSEVLALPDGQRVWVENKDGQFCGVWAVMRDDYRFVGMRHEDSWAGYSEWCVREYTANDSLRVWLLPVSPTKEDLQQKPWIDIRPN